MTDTEQAITERAEEARRAPRLLDAFREVYAEVERSVQALAGPEAPEVEEVRQRIQSILVRQGADARERLGEHELRELDEAQYVMVAMADEVFLGRDWPGRNEWAARPLEAESRFGTHVAGERIFKRLQEILDDRLSVSGDLLSVYLAALSLGFRGRYRLDLDPDAADLARHRRELIRELRRVEPRIVAPAAEICPRAVQGIRDKEPRRGLSALREGLLPLVVVFFSMILLGHALWYYRTNEVRAKLDLIEEQKKKAAEEREKNEKAQRAAQDVASAKAEPAKTEPAKTEPAPAEPAKTTPPANTDGGAP
jgi:type VI secretion system protein ImpK